MKSRLCALLSVGALLFAMVDADKSAAVVNECANELRQLTVTVRPAAAFEWHSDMAVGRLAQFAQKLEANDSVALKLTFVGPLSTWAFARQKLKKSKAHFIQGGLQEFKSLKSFWRSPTLDPWGTGRLDIRVSKSDLLELRPFIELADRIEPENAVGREDEEHIMRGNLSFEERIDRHEVKYWKWMAVQPEKIIHVQTLTSYDKTRFTALAAKIDHDDNGVRVAHTYYDRFLSIGYLTLEAKVKDLKQLVESTPEIHLVHVAGALGPVDHPLDDS